MSELLELTEENVEKLMNECMYKPDGDIADIIPISAISQYYSFDNNEIQNHKEEITHLFSQLADKGLRRTVYMFFIKSDGKLWTKSFKMVDQLIGLGLANGDIEFYYPRELWHSLPKVEPTILIKKEKEKHVELTVENLTDIYDDCVVTTSKDNDDITFLRVEGVSNNYIFNLDKIKKHTAAIKSLVEQVGYMGTFKQFQHFFIRKSGGQWTIERDDVERLIALGLATGFLEFQEPRELWGNSPKNLPYIEIKDPLMKILSSNIN